MIRRLSCLIVTLGLAWALPAAADSRVEKTLKLEPGGRLVVDTEKGAISVTGGSGSAARVVVPSAGRDLEDLLSLRFEEGSRSARITGRRKHHFFNWSNDR